MFQRGNLQWLVANFFFFFLKMRTIEPLVGATNSPHLDFGWRMTVLTFKSAWIFRHLCSYFFASCLSCIFIEKALHNKIVPMIVFAGLRLYLFHTMCSFLCGNVGFNACKSLPAPIFCKESLLLCCSSLYRNWTVQIFVDRCLTSSAYPIASIVILIISFTRFCFISGDNITCWIGCFILIRTRRPYINTFEWNACEL